MILKAENKARNELDFWFAVLVVADPIFAVVFDRYEGSEDRWHCAAPVSGGPGA